MGDYVPHKTQKGVIYLIEKEYNAKIDKIVDSLGCSIFEAKQIIEADKKIDKGQEVDFGLSKEDEKKALKFANVPVHKKPMILNLQKKQPKPDETKENVIQQLFEFLNDKGFAETTILNKSKLISFKIANETFELNLIRKRNSKK